MSQVCHALLLDNSSGRNAVLHYVVHVDGKLHESALFYFILFILFYSLLFRQGEDYYLDPLSKIHQLFCLFFTLINLTV